MSNDTKTSNRTSNLVAERFNQNEKLAQSIAESSPEARQKIDILTEAKERAMTDLVAYQERTFEDRVEKEKGKLMEKYISEPANRLETPEARAQDMALIDEQSRERTAQRDQWNRENLERAYQSNVYAVLNIDRENAQAAHKPQIEPEMDQ